MKTMINDLKADQLFRTYLGINRVSLKKSRNNKEYLMIDLYDVTGKIKGYLFHGIEVAREGLKGKLYAEVYGLTKTHNGNLILQIHQIKGVSENQFDASDVFKEPSKEELEELIRQLYPAAERDLNRDFLGE